MAQHSGQKGSEENTLDRHASAVEAELQMSSLTRCQTQLSERDFHIARNRSRNGTRRRRKCVPAVAAVWHSNAAHHEHSTSTGHALPSPHFGNREALVR